MVCSILIRRYYLHINLKILSEKILDQLFYQIQVESSNWSIIALFKNYQILISQPDFIFGNSDFCECLFCSTVDYDLLDDIKKTIYIMELIKTITDEHVIDAVSFFISGDEGREMKDTLDSYFKFLEKYNFSFPDWEGKNFYYEKLFGIPWILKETGVTIEHYQFRKITAFSDQICGDVLASHGWLADSFADMMALAADHPDRLEGFNPNIA
jgi:hypothetical protein